MPIVIIAVLRLRQIPTAVKTAESFLPNRWKKSSFVISNSDHIRAKEGATLRRHTAARNIPKIPKINSSFRLDNADKYSILKE